MRRRSFIAAFLTVLVGLPALLLPGVPRAADDALVIVVHPERADLLSIDDVVQVYLRRRRAWPDGDLVVPLNLESGHALRSRFSQLVLRQGERQLAEYWNRQYFLGVLPPATLASTEAVRRYVASDRNAIGYLPAAEADASVRVVLRLP